MWIVERLCRGTSIVDDDWQNADDATSEIGVQQLVRYSTKEPYHGIHRRREFVLYSLRNIDRN